MKEYKPQTNYKPDQQATSRPLHSLYSAVSYVLREEARNVANAIRHVRGVFSDGIDLFLEQTSLKQEQGLVPVLVSPGVGYRTKLEDSYDPTAVYMAKDKRRRGAAKTRAAAKAQLLAGRGKSKKNKGGQESAKIMYERAKVRGAPKSTLNRLRELMLAEQRKQKRG